MGAGGPKTETGKAVSSHNATRHGLLAEAPLVTPVEKAEDWEAHRLAVMEELSPDGQMEACLAERAALLIWRLRRVACAEVAAIEPLQAFVEQDYEEASQLTGSPSLDDVRWEAGMAKTVADLLAALPGLPDSSALDAESAVLLFEKCLTAAGMDPQEVDPPMLSAGEPWECAAWTAGLLRAGFAWATAASGVSGEALVAALGPQVRAESDTAARRLREAEKEIGAMRRDNLLPLDRELANLIRYEAHLSRELGRTMRALRELKSDRARTAPSPHHSPDARQQRTTDHGQLTPASSFQHPLGAAPRNGQNCETNSAAGSSQPSPDARQQRTTDHGRLTPGNGQNYETNSTLASSQPPPSLALSSPSVSTVPKSVKGARGRGNARASASRSRNRSR